jgi:hypothetical protein
MVSIIANVLLGVFVVAILVLLVTEALYKKKWQEQIAMQAHCQT